MRAICRRSAEMERMDGIQHIQGIGPQDNAGRQHADDPGQAQLLAQAAAMASPTRKMNARDVNMSNSSL